MPNPKPSDLIANLLSQQPLGSPPSSIVWLSVTLVPEIGTGEYDAFRRRLEAYLGGSGLLLAIALNRIALIAQQGSEPPEPNGQMTGGAIPVRAIVDPADRARVLHWLMNQPEVALIAVARPRPGRSLVQQPTGSNGRGQDSI